MITVEYDTPTEVSQGQYLIMRKAFAGIVAHRQEKGRYWVKLLWPGHEGIAERFLNQ